MPARSWGHRDAALRTRWLGPTAIPDFDRPAGEVHAVRIDRTVGVRLNQSIMVMQTLEQIVSEVDRLAAVRHAAAGTATSAGETAAPNLPSADATANDSRGFFTSLRNAVAGKNR